MRNDELAELEAKLAALAKLMNSDGVTWDEGWLERSSYVILGLLDDGGSHRVASLAEAAGLDPSTVSRQVATVVRRGLARRSSDPSDGRASLVQITDAGTATLDEARRSRRSGLESVMTGWSRDERAQLVEVLARLNGSLTRVRSA